MATTRAISIQTSVPGPRSQAILERKDRVVAEPLSVYLPVVVAEAHGATLTDVDGNTFIDFTGGVGVLNVGHTHPRVVEAVQEQAAKFLHTDFTILPYEVYVSLAERLIALAPFSGPAKAGFFNSGAEAVENAVKFARAYTGRPAVIAFDRGFHGRTLLALSLTSKTHPYKAGLGPFAPEVYRVPFPYAYRGITTEAALEALENAFLSTVAPETVAAIVLEPVQGEGGFIPAPPEFVEGIRRICDREGIVMVADEVQTGFGRTGRMFAMEHFGVEPDLMTVAKSIAAGLPLSGVVGKAEIMDAPADGGVGGTYVGNPVAQAAALAVLDVFEEEGLVERGRHVGDVIRGRMLAWQANARDRARRRSGREDAGTGARHPDRGDGGREGAAAPQGGRLRQLHPRPLPARHLRLGTGRGARGVGRSARRGARVAVRPAAAFYERGVPRTHGPCLPRDR
jgi:4-aminobutyrate aminotransferase/(S)-3-amino-2-methylpropionate transaminase